MIMQSRVWFAYKKLTCESGKREHWRTINSIMSWPPSSSKYPWCAIAVISWARAFLTWNHGKILEEISAVVSFTSRPVYEINENFSCDCMSASCMPRVVTQMAICSRPDWLTPQPLPEINALFLHSLPQKQCITCPQIPFGTLSQKSKFDCKLQCTLLFVSWSTILLPERITSFFSSIWGPEIWKMLSQKSNVLPWDTMFWHYLESSHCFRDFDTMLLIAYHSIACSTCI